MSALLSVKTNLFALGLLVASLAACHPPEQEGITDDLDWSGITQTTQPWTRWWWMGNAVDQPNLDTLLEQYAKAGLGGVEITPIYGAMGYEDQYLDYLSQEWMEALRFTMKKADSLGMGVDMNLGTGWPFGGPQITPQHAASKLFIQKYTLKAGQNLNEKLIINDPKQHELGGQLLALTGYGETDEEVVNLYDKVGEDGTLNWSPDTGNWELYAAFLGKTRQQVKRAAPGGAGYTMDHLSKEALGVYLQRFEEAFGENAPGIRSFFNDSYEVYNADLSPQIFEEFQQMHGYDAREHLKALVSNDTTEEVMRIKADYRKTMAHMLLHNFTLPWTQWIHGQQALSRNQAHGSPGNLLDLYAAVDIPECETFGSTNFPIPGLHKYTNDTRNVEPDPVMMKFASSAAHITGKPLVSSETFTWLGEHFKVPLAQAKPEVEQVFLAGVNHVFFHGTTYSPQEAGWPGWMFYASVNFAPSNSFWPHVKGLNEYISRCQSVLQSGTADHEVMVYWPIYDLWQADAERLERQLTIHGIEEWLHPTDFYQIASGLMKTGYGVDFVSDQLLDSIQVNEGALRAAESGSSYQVLVIPSSSYMPVSTFERILTLAREGSTVIFQQLPEDVPGWHELASRRQQLHDLKASFSWTEVRNGIQEAKTGEGTLLLSEDVQVALDYAGITREELVDTGLKFVRRAVGDDKYYYLVNHTANEIDTHIPLNTAANAVVILDPQDSRRGLADAVMEEGKTLVRVQIAPGESLILRTSTRSASGTPSWLYLDHPDEPISISGPWELSFVQGGPALPPAQQLDQLLSWTELPDTTATRFSGTAMYTTRFNLPEKSADEYLLRLGDVRESARVWVNDQEVGILWSVPYQARVGPYLQEGENTLKIEVANLMANRIRDLDIRGVEWRKYHEINFVNLNYEPFDASGWEPQLSGLLGPVSILSIITDHTL